MSFVKHDSNVAPLWVNSNSGSNPHLINSSALKLSPILTGYSFQYVGQIVTLPFSPPVVKALVDYLNHHNGNSVKEIEIPLRSHCMIHVTDSFDANFIDQVAKNKQQLKELCLAAEELQITSLWCLCCAKIAALIKGHPKTNLKQLVK